MRPTLSPRAGQAVSAAGVSLGGIGAVAIVALGGWSLVLIAVIWFVAVSYGAVWLARTSAVRAASSTQNRPHRHSKHTKSRNIGRHEAPRIRRMRSSAEA
ncbi:uncharacterized protein Nmag_2895 [Natrialba magadii ATCC 43099]|uniref:Uncharacterized protein n=1 Tax=Natrialba magadii (strain ATCC 43099 / DSM 3394 / CCM 3739 / CIP 104546 / IAM 13178 / JCM 8861 / NBRC 102185 / NCIMB 2190 / MS3) TaxID=547559 RepID=D3T0G9_NATMM|nr:hypothetical protein [Natrialba magadii]ADD06448.1 uncharacterized protein Nmag_2895 [Natrialba magadii ATCC 43099]ELY31665.1 hypothetical protein C500_05925 [Natrialba magadii ATCC 43099]